MTTIEPLRHGDRLTRTQFLDRLGTVRTRPQAELIEGVVRLPPKARPFVGYGESRFDLVGLLGTYSMSTPGVEGAVGSAIVLDADNVPRPDLLLMLEPGLKGSATVNDKGYVVGPPELLIEIANTSADYDLHQKMNVYRRNGVAEYGVWRTLEGEFDFFRLSAGKYQRVVPDADPVIRSMVLPGIWLNPAAITSADWVAASTDLRRGIASPEHAAFVAELRGRLDH